VDKRLHRSDTYLEFCRYLQAKALIAGWREGFNFVGTGESLLEAIKLLNKTIQIDQSFTLAYCAVTFASEVLYCIFDRVPERRDFGYKTVETALRLQPQLPEAMRRHGDRKKAMNEAIRVAGARDDGQRSAKASPVAIKPRPRAHQR
jgi:hypothetical protein